MKRWRAILLIVVATAATYARVVGCEFVSWDDPETIAANPRLNPPTAAGVAHYWRHAAGGLYVPVPYTYWSLLASVARAEVDGKRTIDARVFHAASVALHVASALFVYAILRQLIEGEAAACVGALVFALHPVQVESVAWASGAKDVLAGMLALATIHQFLRFSDKPTAGGGSPGPVSPRVHYTAAFVLFTLAILAKPSAVVAPVIALVLASVRSRALVRPLVIAAAPMILLAAACAVWSRAAQAQFAPTETPLWTRPLIAADAVAFYLLKLAWPANLTIIYGRTPRAVVESGAIYYTWALPLAVAVGAWLVRRRTPWIFVGFTAFVVGLLPVLGFARFMFQIHSTVADHYVYLPMLGVAVMSAGAVAALRATPAVLRTSAVALAALAVISFAQVGHWRDSEALFSRVLQFNPNNAFAHGGLGRAYAEQGLIGDAIREFRAAAALAPASRAARASLAQALLLDGQHEAAIAEVTTALQLARPGEDTPWERFILEQALAAREAQPTPTTSTTQP